MKNIITIMKKDTHSMNGGQRTVWVCSLCGNEEHRYSAGYAHGMLCANKLDKNLIPSIVPVA